MTLAKHIISIALLLLIVGCSSDGPVAAKYSPTDCPPAAEPAAQPAEATAEEKTSLVVEPGPEPIELGEEDYDIAEESSDENDDEIVFRTAPGDTIDLNTASEMELTKLTGVGPALAGRIVDYREKRRFEEPSEIRRVRGIGPAKFEKLKEQISVD